MTTVAHSTIEQFIERWTASSAAERANYQLFLSELCDILHVPRPNPTQADDDHNDYVFERNVTFHHGDGTTTTGRIDLYRKSCFVLEAKQGSNDTAATDSPDAPLLALLPRKTRKGTAVRGTEQWDAKMLAARGQAEQYVRALPDDNPPFIIVVDVGHSIELYSDFSRLGKTYTPFPDALSHRIFLKDLAQDKYRDRLRAVWTDPLSLDPARRAAKVTREIASHLAQLARSLEKSGHQPETVATFLMRCLFTLFAEDIGLIKDHGFTALLESIRPNPDQFTHLVRAVWKEMDSGGFSLVLRQKLLRFNGGLFEHCDTLPLTPEQLELLIEAAKADWQDVEPAIFGTLLERALDPVERHKLGAHYTPRAYVERLVLPTIVEPLREDWSAAQAAAVTLAQAGKTKDAIAECREFLSKLCNTIVLDPACGSGNFLYVTLEHLKRLEGEVRDQLRQFGENQHDLEYLGLTVDPHQLRGIELNPRAAAIADLVLWIGYLQWHFKTHGNTAPAEPVLKAFHNIECRDAVLAYDAKELARDEQGKPLSRWDGRTYKKHLVTGEDVPDETARVPVYKYINPRKAEWPKADFVIGNPPFVGNKRMVYVLGEEYSQTLRAIHSDVSEAADFVMYWWNSAACLARSGDLRRFGLITTNSITQSFNRRVLAAHLDAPDPLSVVFAIPDHPWTDSADGAAVRIAMTVGARGKGPGVRWEVVAEEETDHDEIDVVLRTRVGTIHSDLNAGLNTAGAAPLKANMGLCGQGVKLVGDGFFVTSDIGLGKPSPVTGLRAVRRYFSPRDILDGTNGRLVIDFFELTKEQAMATHPAAFQQVVDRVKPLREQNRRDSIRELWWRFAWERPVQRKAIEGLKRYFVTLETSKHRFFVSVDPDCLWDGSLFAFAFDDFYLAGVLSSGIHLAWALQMGGRLEDRPRYQRGPCFETFPFPACTEAQQQKIRELGEALDAHRKRQQQLHPDLTLTDIYNVLEKLRKAEPLSPKDKVIHEHGLVSVLKQIHDDLDTAVFDAYGFPHDLTDEQILERLVALNAQRHQEEQRGIIRWLRPDFQAAQSKSPAPDQPSLDLPEPKPRKAAKPKSAKLPWPPTLAEQARALRSALQSQPRPATVEDLAQLFTRAKADRIAELLETLVSLGHARQATQNRYVA